MTTTEKEWNDVRRAFSTSIMVDTSLSSLAQNLDGPDWPLKEADETPSAYIDLTLPRLIKDLEQKGLPPEAVDQLTGILKETLAFDQPFGEMVAQAEAAGERDNPLLKNMTRLSIPENFPIALTALGADTLDFCKAEKLETLGAFAVFAQGMSKTVIVGGDFRKLLNALSHVDEATLAEVLPFRRGIKGLHLVETLAHAAHSSDPAARATEAIAWFSDDFATIKGDVKAGGSLLRHFAPLADPTRAQEASELIRPHLGMAPTPKASASGKKGLWGAIAKLFGR